MLQQPRCPVPRENRNTVSCEAYTGLRQQQHRRCDFRPLSSATPSLARSLPECRESGGGHRQHAPRACGSHQPQSIRRFCLHHDRARCRARRRREFIQQHRRAQRLCVSLVWRPSAQEAHKKSNAMVLVYGINSTRVLRRTVTTSRLSCSSLPRIRTRTAANAARAVNTAQHCCQAGLGTTLSCGQIWVAVGACGPVAAAPGAVADDDSLRGCGRGHQRKILRHQRRA